MSLIKRCMPEIAFGLLMVLALSALYATGLDHKLIFDDMWVYRTPEILAAPVTVSMNFRSLWTASYQAIYQFIGPELHWQRAFNIALHVGNATLIWALTAQLVGRALLEESVSTSSGDGALGTPRDLQALARVAVPVAVIAWAFNPVAVYAVQYLTQRSTLMATGFVVAGLLAFIAALQARSMTARVAWFAGTAVTCVLAVMSKEHAAPGVALLLPLYVYWQRPAARRLWQGALVLMALAGVMAAWMIARKGWSIGAATEDMVGPFLQQLDALRPGAADEVYSLSVINQAWLFLRYGVLWTVPWTGWMSVDMRPPFPLTWHAFPQAFGAAVFIGIVLASAWALPRRRGRISLLGLIVLVPAILFTTELAFVRLQEPFVLYRSYLWSITLPALWATALLAAVGARQWLIAVGLALAAGFGAQAFERIQSLRDESVAWRDAMAKMDLNGPANALGRWRAPLNLSRADLVRENYEDAFRYAQLADRLSAPDGLGKFNMGSVLLAVGRPQQALPLLQAAEREGYKGAELWASLGGALEQVGRADDAFAAYDRALRANLDPKYRPGVLQQAGRLANAVGRYDKANTYFSQLLQLQPDASPAVMGAAFARLRRGDAADALSLLSDAIDRRPAADLYHARAMVHLQAGNRQQATRDIAEALARDPHNPVYLTAQRQIQAESGAGARTSKP